MAEFEVQEDIGLLFEWAAQDKIRAIDCGELKDFELFSGELPVTAPQELDVKKDPKKDLKGKKKTENILEQGKSYSGFFELVDDDVRVDEVFCNSLCNNLFRIAVCNTEDMKVLCEFKIDYSRLLLHNTDEAGKFKICLHEDLEVSHTFPWLKALSIRVETDQTLLKPEFKHFLNPLLINVHSLENLYIDPKRVHKLEPLKVRYDLLGTGQFVESQRKKTQKDMQLECRHVFLMGQKRQIDLKEHFESHKIEVEVHDRDEVKLDTVKKSVEYLELKEPEPIEDPDDPKKKKKGTTGTTAAPKKPEPTKKKDDQKKDPKKKKDKKKDYTFEDFQMPAKVDCYQREFGISTFYLKDVLNPYNLHYRLQAPICPRRVFVDDDRDNLNLNQTARKKGREIVKATDYFGNSSFLNLEIELAFPLDRYKAPEVPKEELDPKSDPKKQPKDAKPKIPDPKQKPLQQEEEKAKVIEEISEKALISQVQKVKPLTEKPLIERAIYIFEYKNREFLKLLQKTIVDIDLEGLKIENGSERDVRTKKLTAEERLNKGLDYIGGVEFIDKHYRVFILEGVSHLGMKKT